MKLLIAILSFIFLIIPIAVIDLLVKLLGLIAVAIALPFAKEKEAPEWNYPSERITYDGWKFIALPEPFQSIWGSDKYGANGNFLWPAHGDVDSFIMRYRWLALRNPASNWSYNPLMNYIAKYENIEHIGSDKIDDNNGITGFRFTYDKTAPWRSGLVWLKRYGNSERGLWMRLGFLQYNDKDSGEFVSALKGMLLPHPWKKIPKPDK